MNGITVSLPELLKLEKEAARVFLHSHATTRAHRHGSYQSAFKGRGIDFDETRIYQPGDDIRLIDWRVTARTGRAHTKVFREEKDRPILLGIDFSPSMYFATKTAFKSVLAAKLAATLAWSAILQGERVGGIVFNPQQHIEIKPMHRKEGLLPLLHHLARMSQLEKTTNMTSAYSLIENLKRLQRLAKPGSVVFLISDLYEFDNECIKQLSFLSKQTKIAIIWLYDILERQLPKPNLYAITDGTEQKILDTTNKTLIENFHKKTEERVKFIRKNCQQLAIRLLEISTEDDWLKKLTTYLAQEKL